MTSSNHAFTVHHPIFEANVPGLDQLRQRADARATRVIEVATRLASHRIQVRRHLESLRRDLQAPPWWNEGRMPVVGHAVNLLTPIDVLRALVAAESDLVSQLVPSPVADFARKAEQWGRVAREVGYATDLEMDPAWAHRWALADLRHGTPQVTVPYLLASVGYERLAALVPFSEFHLEGLDTERSIHRRCVERARTLTQDRIFTPLGPAYLDRHGGLADLDQSVALHHGVVIVGPEDSGRTALLDAWLRRLAFNQGPKPLAGCSVWVNPFDAPWFSTPSAWEDRVAGGPCVLALTPKGRRSYYDEEAEEEVSEATRTGRAFAYEPEYAAGAPETRLLSQFCTWATHPWRSVYVVAVMTREERERLVAQVPDAANFAEVEVPPIDELDHLPIWLCHAMDTADLGLSHALAVLTELRPADVARTQPWCFERLLGSALAQKLYDPARISALRPDAWLRRALRRVRAAEEPWTRELHGAKRRFVERFLGNDERFAALVSLEERLRTAATGVWIPEAPSGRGAPLLDDAADAAQEVPDSTEALISLPTGPLPPNPEELPSDVYLVYRSQYDGPLSKRVRRLRGRSVLEWFQVAWDQATRGGDPSAWLEAECGGPVHGLSSILQAALDEGLDAPTTTHQLQDLLLEHLYVGGGADNIRLDDNTLRVKTDDDEVELAYYFFSRSYAEVHRERCSFLLQEEWALPQDAVDAPFDPVVGVRPLGPDGSREGMTYVCLHAFYDANSLCTLRPHLIRGVRLPDLVAYLRSAEPAAIEHRDRGGKVWYETWPLELRLLRAFIEDKDTCIDGALRRCNAYPLEHVGTNVSHTRLGLRSRQTAREEFEEAAADARGRGRDPSKSLIAVGPHSAQVCMHASDVFGYQQWFLFDDQWAAAHPNMARSLLRYTSGWDPFA